LDSELIQKILRLNGEHEKSEIGALFREFEGSLTQETAGILKEVYRKNIYNPGEDTGKSYFIRQRIKENCAYIRRSAILALLSMSRS